MDEPTGPTRPLRERRRSLTRQEIADRAWELYTRQGFDTTTVDQIAAAAGVSPRTFFRYFATKEDTVVDDPDNDGDDLRAVLAGRPPDEHPATSVHLTLRERTRRWSADPERTVATIDLLERSASLRARQREQARAWERLLAVQLRTRLGDDADAALRAEALCAASLACLDVAVRAWVRDTSRSLDELFDETTSILVGAVR